MKIGCVEFRLLVLAGPCLVVIDFPETPFIVYPCRAKVIEVIGEKCEMPSIHFRILLSLS